MNMSLLFQICTSLSLAAPGPKVIDLPYYPTKIGDVLIYSKSLDGEARQDKIETVTGVESTESGVIVTMSLVAGDRRVFHSKAEVSRSGVKMLKGSTTEGTFPGYMIQLPAKPGETWDAEYKIGEISGKITHTIKKNELLEVPAGKFLCVRVDSEITGFELKARKTRWYAVRFGLVKEVSVVANIETTQILKSFEAGK